MAQGLQDSRCAVFAEVLKLTGHLGLLINRLEVGCKLDDQLCTFFNSVQSRLMPVNPGLQLRDSFLERIDGLFHVLQLGLGFCLCHYSCRGLKEGELYAEHLIRQCYGGHR